MRGSPGLEGATGTCNFSDTACWQLTQDIRANLQNEIMKNVGKVLLPLLELNCTQYLNGFRGQSKDKPVSTCKHIYQCSLSTAPSGYYWITTSNGTAIRVYCAMNLTHCGNTTGGWTRVAFINAVNSGCPGGLNSTSTPKRLCWLSTSGPGCSSVTLPAFEGSYTKVCGRALGYQYYSTLAFFGKHHINTVQYLNLLNSLNATYWGLDHDSYSNL